MKTIVIWDCLDTDIKFCVLDGDYTRFNNIYIGSSDNQELVDELCDIFFEPETGEYQVEFVPEFPGYLYARHEACKTIVCGVVP